MMTCVMPPTASSMMVTPKNIRNELKIRPQKLSGCTSAYPTVLIVISVM